MKGRKAALSAPAAGRSGLGDAVVGSNQAAQRSAALGGAGLEPLGGFAPARGSFGWVAALEHLANRMQQSGIDLGSGT